MAAKSDKRDSLEQLLTEHSRFKRPPRGAKCDSFVGTKREIQRVPTETKYLYRCTYTAKYKYTPLEDNSLPVGDGGAGNYCAVHMFKYLRHNPKEMRAILTWAKLRLNGGPSFVKVYPRRFVRLYRANYLDLLEEFNDGTARA